MFKNQEAAERHGKNLRWQFDGTALRSLDALITRRG